MYIHTYMYTYTYMHTYTYIYIRPLSQDSFHIQHIAFGVSCFQSQISIDYLVLYLSCATFLIHLIPLSLSLFIYGLGLFYRILFIYTHHN